jgi:CBS domain-containing protein
MRIFSEAKKPVLVAELMSPHPKTCAPNDSCAYAAQLMWDNDCGCVPVLDENGKAVAMITDRDICMAALTQGRLLSDIPVARVFSTNVVTVRDDLAIESAEAVMRKHRIRRVPVVDAKDRAVGVLSLNDLARHAGHDRGSVDVDKFVRILAAICEPTARATVR